MSTFHVTRFRKWKDEHHTVVGHPRRQFPVSRHSKMSEICVFLVDGTYRGVDPTCEAYRVFECTTYVGYFGTVPDVIFTIF